MERKVKSRRLRPSPQEGKFKLRYFQRGYRISEKSMTLNRLTVLVINKYKSWLESMRLIGVPHGI